MASDTALWNAVPGCKTNTDDYCICDTTKGWMIDPSAGRYC